MIPVQAGNKENTMKAYVKNLAVGQPATLNAIQPKTDSKYAEAVHIGLNKSWWTRLRIQMRHLLRANKATDVEVKVTEGIRFSLISDLPKTKRILARFTKTADGRKVMAQRAVITNQVIGKLAKLPETTLGGAYARWVLKRQFDPEFYPLIFELSDEERFALTRRAQVHDATHVITGYDSTEEGEVALMLFNFSQEISFITFIIGFGGLFAFGIRQPRLFVPMIQALFRGLKSPDLSTIPWEDYWHLPLSEVRQRLGLTPVYGDLPCFLEREPIAA